MLNNFKLVRKFALLAIMLLGTSFAVFSDTNAASLMPCCSECETIFQNCIDNGGTFEQCNQESSRCFRRCSFSC